MKIICVGRNYAAHARELKNEVPDNPVIFLKPDTAVPQRKMPFIIPPWTQDVHYEAELVIRISRNGKHIAERFARKYFAEITLGIDFTARDLQEKLRKKGLPWELAKGFDGSAPAGEFIPVKTLENAPGIAFRLDRNGRTVQEGNSADMIFSFDKIISFVSGYFTLREGDLLFTGTPSGVGRTVAGDKLEGYIEGKRVLTVNVR